MSFFQIPISAVNFQPQQQERTIPRQFSSHSSIPVNQGYNQFNEYFPIPVMRSSQPVERNVPFKVYVFEGKFNHNLNSASNVLRFEIDSNNERSFELFDRILKEHSFDKNQYELHYVDDEDDYRDFKFMLKLMNGKLIKIVCEKSRTKPQHVPLSRTPQQFPWSFDKEAGTQSWHNIFENAVKSAFSNEESTQPRQSIPQSKAANTSSHVASSVSSQQTPKVRSIEINLADLLGFAKRKNEESKINKMKEEQKKQESTQEKKEEEKSVETSSPTSPSTEEVQVSEPEIISTTVPNLSTSLLLSNLIEEPVVSQQVVEPVNQPVDEPVSNQDLESQDPIIESIPFEIEEPVVKTSIPHKYQKEMKLLNDMGFSNHILNVTLLNKYEGNIQRTISDLIHQTNL